MVPCFQYPLCKAFTLDVEISFSFKLASAGNIVILTVRYKACAGWTTNHEHHPMTSFSERVGLIDWAAIDNSCTKSKALAFSLPLASPNSFNFRKARSCDLSRISLSRSYRNFRTSMEQHSHVCLRERVEPRTLVTVKLGMPISLALTNTWRLSAVSPDWLIRWSGFLLRSGATIASDEIQSSTGCQLFQHF